MNLKRLRKNSFSKWFDPDSALTQMISGHESHAFLNNPPIANIYQYLSDYVLSVSENLIGKKAKDIEILDWGSGKGHVSYMLKKIGFDRLKSCDIDEDRNDSTFGQSHPIIDQTDLKIIPLKHEYLLPFADDSFDVVVSYGVLEHVPNDLESMKEIFRILKPGGLFFCFHLPRKLGYVHFLSRLKGNYYHDRLYNQKTIESLSKASNFVLLDVWERTVLPKNTINYKANALAEKVDQLLSDYTPFKIITNNIEFLAQKP